MPSKSVTQRKLDSYRQRVNRITIQAIDNMVESELGLKTQAVPQVPAKKMPATFSVAFLGMAHFFRMYVIDDLVARGLRGFDVWLGTETARLDKIRSLTRMFLYLCETKMWNVHLNNVDKPQGHTFDPRMFTQEAFSVAQPAFENLPRPIVRMLDFLGKFVSLARTWLPYPVKPIDGNDTGSWQLHSCLWSSMTNNELEWLHDDGVTRDDYDRYNLKMFEEAFDVTFQVLGGVEIPPVSSGPQKRARATRSGKVLFVAQGAEQIDDQNEDIMLKLSTDDLRKVSFEMHFERDMDNWRLFKQFMMERVNWVNNADINKSGSPGQVVAVENGPQRTTNQKYFTQTLVEEEDFVFGMAYGTGFVDFPTLQPDSGIGLGADYCYQDICFNAMGVKNQVIQYDGPIHPV